MESREKVFQATGQARAEKGFPMLLTMEEMSML